MVCTGLVEVLEILKRVFKEAGFVSVKLSGGLLESSLSSLSSTSLSLESFGLGELASVLVAQKDSFWVHGHGLSFPGGEGTYLQGSIPVGLVLVCTG